jgi:hypothetical protein
MMPLITHDEAHADVQRQFLRLRDELHCGPSTLKKFIFSIRKARAKIRMFPKAWSYAKGSKTVRKVQIKGFRMTVFYVIANAETVHVLEYAGPGLQPRGSERF